MAKNHNVTPIYQCYLFGVALIIFEICCLLYYDINSNLQSQKSGVFDLQDIIKVSSELDIPFYIFDSELLDVISNPELKIELGLTKRPILLGVDARFTGKVNKIKLEERLRYLSFEVVVLKKQSSDSEVDVAYLWKRSQFFYCLVLYTREDNTWWFGYGAEDKLVHKKLGYLGLKENALPIRHEGVLDKFETVLARFPGHGFEVSVPKRVGKFRSDLADSRFVECNLTRSAVFKRKYENKKAVSQRFKHRAWKLLAKTKTVLDLLSITFWLSSGTCLGYFRECDIIAHSLDVDIGVFASNYSERIIPEMQAQGLALKHWFGKLSDSLELSFVDRANGIKLDMFFFYEDKDVYWNGGTQAKSGLKFKYSFPKFRLCWTLFKELKLKVPCDTETYIKANYGPDWDIPVTRWDWKTSPYNVRPNGIWPQSEWPNVIKVYN